MEWVLKEGGEGLESGLSGDAGEGAADADEDMADGNGDGADDTVDAKALAEGLKKLVVKEGEEKK